ncbi:MAG TPA: M1 family aminopeptidase [Thermoanaerobaculia bacterium]|nr:M1 family aminopeptidase [Thermoanaerobaculia bacterium]
MKHLTAFLIAVAVLVSPLSAAESLTNTIAAYDGMTIGQATVVNDVKLTSGHMTFTLSSGQAAPIVAGNETIGLFFTGKGTYEHISNDPAEAATVKHNVKKVSDLTLSEKSGSLAIADSFEQLLYIRPGAKFPQLSASSTISVDAPFNEFKKYFGRDSGAPFAHLWALKKLDAPAGELVMAHVRGGQDSAVYVFDDVLNHKETLQTLREPRSESRLANQYLYRAPISEQLINRKWKDYYVQNYLQTAIDLDFTASDKKDVKYTMTQTVVPMNAPRRVFRFELFNEVLVGISDLRKFNLRSVTGADGKPLEFSHRNDELIVATPAHVGANMNAVMKFEVDGDFLFRPQGDSFWELGTFPWFPQGELGEQFYTWHSIMRVKKPFVPLAPGTTIRRVEEGDYNVVETKLDKPVQFASLLAGRYYFAEDARDGLTVRVASYGLKNEMAFKKLANLAHQMIDYYETFLGPFPFTEFNIIEKNQYGYGQAPPATMFITQEAFNPLDDEASKFFSQGINHRYAHEIAHQYWGHVVKMPSGEEQWLTESFAEYSSSLLINKMKGKRAYETMISEWRRNGNTAAEASTIPMANRLRGEGGGMHRTNLVYNKGAYLLAVLHKQLGDEKFLTFLKSYQKTFNFKYGTTAHVAGMLQFVTKQDFNAYFDQNFWGTGMPAETKK